MITKEAIAQWFTSLQENICQQLEEADGTGRFQRDYWERPGGGGGLTRVLSGGRIIEKGGVNFSAVEGDTPPAVLKHLGIDLDPLPRFFATGVSIVLHPHNPQVPIIHMNVRFFEMSNGIWWFGGGIDLTPHYIDEGDAQHFHRTLKTVCDAHHPDYYATFKQWADDYFYIKHRQETRGIGGIFFDHLKDDAGFTRDQRFAFIQAVGEAFAPLYAHYMQKNHALPYGEREQTWQAFRRGRYVEFNLVWDRGTKFGLDTDGRTESILMSLPPQAQWVYDYQAEPSSPEQHTLDLLRKGIDWT